MRALGLILLAAWLTGCADDQGSSDGGGTIDRSYDGLYQYTSHRRTLTCSQGAAWTDMTYPEPYFRLATVEAQGKWLLGYYPCSNATPASCESQIAFFQSLAWRDGAWIYDLVATMFTGGVCHLTEAIGPPVKTATGFDIQLTHRSGTPAAASQDACQAELALAMAESDFNCEWYEAYSATRIE